MNDFNDKIHKFVHALSLGYFPLPIASEKLVWDGTSAAIQTKLNTLFTAIGGMKQHYLLVIYYAFGDFRLSSDATDTVIYYYRNVNTNPNGVNLPMILDYSMVNSNPFIIGPGGSGAYVQAHIYDLNEINPCS